MAGALLFPHAGHRQRRPPPGSHLACVSRHRYAAQVWNQGGVYTDGEGGSMGVSDWHWRHPTELQDTPWDCAAASTAWALQACGHPYTEAEVVKGLGRHRISPAWGLLDASGAGIVEWLGEIGIGAENNPAASWADVVGAAGHQPMLMGGMVWCHWTGVRISTLFYPELEPEALALANPAPGWGGIEQTMQADAFDRLGPFAAVWLTSW